LDRRFMRRALVLAGRGVGFASPNPTVGCVVVRDGVIRGEGWHRYAHLAHAEAVALREAGRYGSGSTVYVTLEPCAHVGRTPACADLIIRTGVRRVVVAMRDPDPRTSGVGLDRLRAAGIAVDFGAGKKKAVSLNEAYVHRIANGRPLVIGKAGMSLDGRIATASGASQWITSERSRRMGQRLRRQVDAILVGIGTVLADDPELTDRGRPARDREPWRVVLDSHLRIPLSSRLAQTARRHPTIVCCRTDAPARKRKRLEAMGVEVVPVRARAGGLAPERILDMLGQRQALSVLVEGGGQVHGAFLRAGLMDKFYFIVAPIIIGGERSVPAIGGRGYRSLTEVPRCEIVKVFSSGPDLVLEVRFDREDSPGARLLQELLHPPGDASGLHEG